MWFHIVLLPHPQNIWKIKNKLEIKKQNYNIYSGSDYLNRKSEIMWKTISIGQDREPVKLVVYPLYPSPTLETKGDHRLWTSDLKTARTSRGDRRRLYPDVEGNPNTTVQRLAWQELLDCVLSSTHHCVGSWLPTPPSIAVKQKNSRFRRQQQDWEKLFPQIQKTAISGLLLLFSPVHSKKERNCTEQRKMEGWTEGREARGWGGWAKAVQAGYLRGKLTCGGKHRQVT